MSSLRQILDAIAAAGGHPFEVGGCVRDSLLGIACKDVDIEVFQLSIAELIDVLGQFGEVHEVGVSFGVIKLRLATGEFLDFTLPRRDSKEGRGHKGFRVEVDHSLSISEAAARRDFTINAISRDCRDGRLVDPHGGIADLEQRVLRHVSPHFAEDPLRVLRGMQFAGRFDLTLADATAELCRSLLSEFTTLSIERVWGEWHKWATKSRRPSRGLEFLNQSGWLEHFPELAALRGVPQDPEWHPEGDTWVHTLSVCDAAAAVADRENLSEDQRVVLLLAALCHDLGKATTTEFLDGRWRAHGHCDAGVPLAQQFLARIGCPLAIIETVLPQVQEHLVHTQRDISPRLVRRLALRLAPATIEQLLHLVEADMSGRPPLPGGLPASARQLAEIAHGLALHGQKPQPILLGRYLIARGFTPSEWFGEVLALCFEAQLEGTFTELEDGLRFLDELLRQLPPPPPPEPRRKSVR